MTAVALLVTKTKEKLTGRDRRGPWDDVVLSPLKRGIVGSRPADNIYL